MKVIGYVYIEGLILLLLFTHDVRMKDMIIERKNVSRAAELFKDTIIIIDLISAM